MTRALLAAAALLALAADLAGAATFSFTIPTRSVYPGTCDTIPNSNARVVRLRTWVMDAEPSSPSFNRWQPYLARNWRYASVDGKRFEFAVPWWVAPGDSFGIRVAVGNARLWGCRDAVVYSRRMP